MQAARFWGSRLDELRCTHFKISCCEALRFRGLELVLWRLYLVAAVCSGLGMSASGRGHDLNTRTASVCCLGFGNSASSHADCTKRDTWRLSVCVFDGEHQNLSHSQDLNTGSETTVLELLVVELVES